MKYRALRSFCGQISMAMGDVREIPDKSIAEDLLKAGYVEAVEAEKKPAKKTAKKTK